MIQITLKGGTVKEYQEGISVADIAKDLSMGLYKAACAAKVNGAVCDLRTVLHANSEVEILTFDDPEGKKAFCLSRFGAGCETVISLCEIGNRSGY